MINRTKTLLSNIILLFGIAIFVFISFPEDPCNKTITYSISDIDPRFGLTKEDATNFAENAALVWNRGIGREVFKYEPNGEVKITFIYDERQRQTIQNNILKESAQEKTNKLSEQKEYIEIRRENFTEEKEGFENEVKNFNKNLQSYNNLVITINRRGGATIEEMQELQTEKNNLQDQMYTLEQRQEKLNSYLRSINKDVEQYNEGINNVNSIIETINQNSHREFEQGYYQNKNIVLYEYEDYKSLQRLIAHELGHALGIEHTKNPNSLMYYINQGESLTLTKEDIDAYKETCGLK